MAKIWLRTGFIFRMISSVLSPIARIKRCTPSKSWKIQRIVGVRVAFPRRILREKFSCLGLVGESYRSFPQFQFHHKFEIRCLDDLNSCCGTCCPWCLLYKNVRFYRRSKKSLLKCASWSILFLLSKHVLWPAQQKILKVGLHPAEQGAECGIKSE